MLERLQKILSAAGVSSRRAAEKLIVDGRVTVNGATILELGTKADAERDDIRVDGSRVRPATVQRRHILLNKPRGYVSTRSDPEGRPTVIDLVGEDLGRLYPVGRLDFDTEGLIILTNDGELAQQLMHPRHEVPKEYHARVRGLPDDRALSRLRRGVVIDGRRTLPAEVGVVETGRGARGDQSILSLVIREGRTRQVRKMCEMVGLPILRLRRVRIGPLTAPSLKVGAFRELRREELQALRDAVLRPAAGAATPSGLPPRTAPAPTRRASKPAYRGSRVK